SSCVPSKVVHYYLYPGPRQRDGGAVAGAGVDIGDGPVARRLRPGGVEPDTARLQDSLDAGPAAEEVALVDNIRGFRRREEALGDGGVIGQVADALDVDSDFEVERDADERHLVRVGEVESQMRRLRQVGLAGLGDGEVEARVGVPAQDRAQGGVRPEIAAAMLRKTEASGAGGLARRGRGVGDLVEGHAPDVRGSGAHARSASSAARNSGLS